MTTVDVKIQRLPGNSDLPLPSYQSQDAVGMDLHAAVTADVTLAPGATAGIPCGFAMALPPGYEAQVRPRSGLALKKGITVVNAPGTIDSDYRGEIVVLLVNLGADPQSILPGDRIAQMVIAPVVQAEIVEVNEISATERGGGGFGHTGR